MTPALQKMVEAMEAEIERQARDEDAMPYVADGFAPGSLKIDGDINLENVARAGLEAIRILTPEVFEAMGDAWFAPGATGFWDVQSAMIDAILKETP